MSEANIDHQALRELVTTLTTSSRKKWCVTCGAGSGSEHWCVACGAGSHYARAGYPSELVDEVGRQFLDPTVLREFVVAVTEAEARIELPAKGLPAEIDDEFIEELARRLIRRSKETQ